MSPRPSQSDGPSESEARSSAANAGRLGVRPPPWSGEPEAGSFGSWLRRQREAREVSLRDIAERTKISLRYLEAMEEDRFDVLPAPVFAKGFLREYARYVGLSPDEVVNHYLSVQPAQEGEERTEEARVELRRSGNWTSVLYVLLVVLIVALLTLLGYLFVKHRNAPSAESVPAASEPAPPATGASSAASVPPAPLPVVAAAPPAASQAAAEPSAPLELTLDFTGECWLQAVVDGKERIEEERVQGESRQIEAKTSIVLTLGNAGGVEAQVNGLPLPLNGKKGEVVHDLRIDLDTVAALKKKKETP